MVFGPTKSKVISAALMLGKALWLEPEQSTLTFVAEALLSMAQSASAIIKVALDFGADIITSYQIAPRNYIATT
jgi:hypothetical protein